VGGPKLVT